MRVAKAGQFDLKDLARPETSFRPNRNDPPARAHKEDLLNENRDDDQAGTADGADVTCKMTALGHRQIRIGITAKAAA